MPLAGRDVISSQRTSLQTLFQSTRPLRGATLSLSHFSVAFVISIHAPLAGRDRAVKAYRRNKRHFNPRAPCGARRAGAFTPANRKNFNPRAPCGARRFCFVTKRERG